MPLTICRMGAAWIPVPTAKEQINQVGSGSTTRVQVLCSNAGTLSYGYMGQPYNMCARPNTRRRRRGYGPRRSNPRQSDALANGDMHLQVAYFG